MNSWSEISNDLIRVSEKCFRMRERETPLAAFDGIPVKDGCTPAVFDGSVAGAPGAETITEDRNSQRNIGVRM